MRRSRRSSCAEGEAKESPAGRTGGSKRKRRSVSAGNRRCEHPQLPPHRSVTGRECPERHYVEEYRSEDKQGRGSGHHSSKSSGHSGRSSYRRRHRTHRAACHQRHPSQVGRQIPIEELFIVRRR